MISVHEAEKLSLKGIAAFLHASEEIHFLGENRPQVYAWMETGVAPTAVRAARPQGARSAAALPGEDDRAQPGASDALDCPLSSPGHGGSGELSAAPLCAALHAGRHRTAGRRRRGPRHAQRTGHTAHSAARIPAVRQAGV